MALALSAHCLCFSALSAQSALFALGSVQASSARAWPASSRAWPTSGWRKAALHRRRPIKPRPLAAANACLLHRHIAPICSSSPTGSAPGVPPMGAPPGRARRAASTTGASSTAVPHPANTSFPPKSWSSALDPWLSSTTSRSTAYNGASRSSCCVGERTHAVASRRWGVICKTYGLQTAQNAALYIP